MDHNDDDDDKKKTRDGFLLLFFRESSCRSPFSSFHLSCSSKVCFRKTAEQKATRDSLRDPLNVFAKRFTLQVQSVRVGNPAHLP